VTDHRGAAHKLIIASSALTMAEQAASSRTPRETGGILIGFRSDSDIYITDVVEVADDHSTRCRFVLREGSREQALARYLDEAPPECPFGYVGSWHSHPAQVGASGRDIRTLRREARTTHDLVAMMILMQAPDGAWQVDGAVGYRKRAIAHRAVWRRLEWRPLIVKADLILRPAGQPTPPG